MNAKKIITWLVVIFVVWYILSSPDGAAAFGQHLINGLRTGAKSLASFFSHL